ncbi:MAG: RelA/SpoT [Candidatus Paceibacterota bacterium]
MTQKEFLALYEADKPALRALGNYVNNAITKGIKIRRKIDSLDLHLKIPVFPRLKTDKSILEKAFLRKNYSNPYSDITDKIGVRYVVLLTEHVTEISDVVESIDGWEVSKDRDFETEREENPLLFDYQSIHYVIRLKNNVNYEGIEISSDLSCEVQIRTLAQHAYSELTHDMIYKSRLQAKPEVQRAVAKSMSLIEIIDSIFMEVHMTITEESRDYDSMFNELTIIYEGIQSPNVQERLNFFLLDTFKSDWEGISISSLKKFIEEKPFIADKIKEKSQHNLLFEQPIVILLYYLISKNPRSVFKQLPITESEFKPLFVDLGISTEQFNL